MPAKTSERDSDFLHEFKAARFARRARRPLRGPPLLPLSRSGPRRGRRRYEVMQHSCELLVGPSLGLCPKPRPSLRGGGGGSVVCGFRQGTRWVGRGVFPIGRPPGGRTRNLRGAPRPSPKGHAVSLGAPRRTRVRAELARPTGNTPLLCVACGQSSGGSGKPGTSDTFGTSLLKPYGRGPAGIEICDPTMRWLASLDRDLVLHPTRRCTDRGSLAPSLGRRPHVTPIESGVWLMMAQRRVLRGTQEVRPVQLLVEQR